MAAVVPAGEIVRAIQQSLALPVISHSAATPEYDLYEVYLFGLCVEAAESIGMTASFEDTAGTSVKSLTLRKAPSPIWSQAQRFTHAVLAKDGTVRLEVHLGVYVRAGSGVSHEADVVVIDATEAARARALQTDPPAKKAAIIIEAKFHGSSIRLRTGREFLGLAVDVGARPTIFVSSSPGSSVHRLLSHRGRSGHFELIPQSNQEGELRGQIATKLRDYLARR